MGRRKQSDAGSSVSLFPFLSILACVIGTLTLMITALALGQMDDPAIADAAQLDAAERSTTADEKKIKELEKQLQEKQENASESQSEFAKSQARLARLNREEKQLQAEHQEVKNQPVVIPKIDLAKQQKELEELQAQLAKQQTALKELRAELAQRNKKPEEAVVSIRPSGSGVDLEPVFVECTPGSLLLFNSDMPHRVRRADLATDEKFLALLEQVAKAKKATVIFLVREEAMSMYYAARDVANANDATNGKLPVIGQGKIDLSMFQ